MYKYTYLLVVSPVGTKSNRLDSEEILPNIENPIECGH